MEDLKSEALISLNALDQGKRQQKANGKVGEIRDAPSACCVLI